MKNKLSYLIGVACFLSYTGVFTSCVNGVDDEYLEQKFTDNGGTDDEEEGEELPDLNGEYSIEGDFDLVMTCNGNVLEGKKVVMTVDEGNETASITFAAAQTDLETAIATAIPGGVGGLVSGWGLKYTGNSPVPGEKEITITDVPLFRNGTSYMFKGSNVQPTYNMNYEGKIEDEKLTVDINYELTNQKLAGKWYSAKMSQLGAIPNHAPFWADWASKVILNPGKVVGVNFSGTVNTMLGTVDGMFTSEKVMEGIVGKKIKMNQIVFNLLEYVAAEPNGNMFASYSYNPDITIAGPYSQEMPHDVIRYYFDPEKPDERIYLELNSGFLINMIGSLGSSLSPSRSTRADDGDLRERAKALIKLLVPVLEKGIPCEYKLDGNNLTINVDGVVLRNILAKLMVVINDSTIQDFLNGAFDSLGDTKDFVVKLLEELPKALDENECQYVKVGLKFVKK